MLDSVGNLDGETTSPDAWATSGLNRAGECYEKRAPVITNASKVTNTEEAVSQEETDIEEEKIPEGKTRKWGKIVREHCPAIYINDQLTNCDKLTPNEQRCMGLLNFLMKNPRGYAFVSDQQLAHWLNLRNPASVDNMLRKFRKGGFVKDEGVDRYNRRKLVVCEQWRNGSEPEPF
jgi:hypothetical protein